LSNFVPVSKMSSFTNAYSTILGMPNLAAREDSRKLSYFEVQGASENLNGHKAKILLHAPSTDSQREQMGRGGGSFLGDLVIGVSAVSAGTNYPERIDTTEGEFGGMFLDLL